jgi:hypothetical protein
MQHLSLYVIVYYKLTYFLNLLIQTEMCFKLKDYQKSESVNYITYKFSV